MAKPHIKPRVDAFPLGWYGGAHHGASTTHKDVSEWYASGGSADGDLFPDLDELKNRSRDIRRNSGFAHGIAETLVDGIVGPGIRFCSQPNWVSMQRIDPQFSETWAEDWAEQYEALFHEWFWSTACHAGDTMTGDMLAEQACYAKIENGASLTLPLWLPKRGDGYATKLQPVEIDRLSNPRGAPETPKMRGGIEFDDFGVPMAAHIRKTHPGDSLVMLDFRSGEWERVPWRTSWGRLRVIHDFDAHRADQTRGKPLFSAVLAEFKNIDRYVKYEIQAALANSFIWGAITSPMDNEQVMALFKGDQKAYNEARAAYAVKMRSGTLATLFPGDKLESFIPQRPNPQFGVFVENIEKIISVGCGVPHLLAKKDFSKSNYSNTRAAISELWRVVSRRRDRFGAGYLDKVNALFAEEVVNDGRIKAPRFYELRRSYLAGMWIGPPRGYVDKEKEIKGDVLAVQSDLGTLQRIAAEQGMHWKDLIRQRARERKFAAEQGLPDLAPLAGTVAANPSPPDEPKPTGDETTGTDQ